MAVYRDDPDLQFLGQCESEDLDLLVSIITHDPRDSALRWTETLSGSESYIEAELARPTAPLLLMAIQTAVRASGFAACRLSLVMLSTLAKVALGRTLPIVTYLTLTRTISVLAGPVGWTLSTGGLLAGISGPARRVAVPVCLVVACLRQQYLHHTP